MSDVIAQINDQEGDTQVNKEANIDDVIPIDGKALRGSRPARGKKMVHTVSAYSTKLSLILGFTPVENSKIHERTAAKSMATIRRCCFNAHNLSGRFPKEMQDAPVIPMVHHQNVRLVNPLVKEYSGNNIMGRAYTRHLSLDDTLR